MRRISVRSQARADIKQIAAMIAKESPRSALRFFLAVEKLVKRLLDFPELGGQYETVDDELTGLRVLSIGRFRNHLLFYRVHDDAIEVVRVLHGARDIPVVLKGKQ